MSRKFPRPAAPVKRIDPRFVIIVGMMAALPAVSTDMYLPSLPDVVIDLNTTKAAAQLSLTGVLIGGGVGQLIIGPLSDRYGRRRPFMAGITLHIITSILCALAPGIVSLIALRFIQGFGNAAAGVIAMAVIRDRFVGADAARMMSRLTLVIGAAPMLAPSLGSVIAGWWGWSAVFYVLALGGAILMFIVWRFLPETLSVSRRRSQGVLGALRGYRHLFRDRLFIAFAILPGIGLTVVMGYVTGAPFVFQEGYGLTEHQFALLFALNGMGMVIAAQINAALVRRYAPVRVLRLAVLVSMAMGTALLLITITRFGGLIGTAVPLAFMLMINNFVASNGGAIALSRHGDRAGSAAAVMGAMQMGFSGIAASLVGVLAEHVSNSVAMAIVMLSAITLAFLILLLATPVYRNGGWQATVTSTDPEDE